jgi:soluble lytic murein transglycosylase-like protein
LTVRFARFSVLLAAAAFAGVVHAGAQVEEPMAASVRTALSTAIAERAIPEPQFVSLRERIDWLSAMSDRLPRKWVPQYFQRMDFLKLVRYEAQRAGLDPQLVLALIEVESGFRRYAVSTAGARGYMQVMPFWSRVIGDGDAGKLFDMRANLRYGCTILRHYLDRENGDLYRALGRYNGSLGRPEYPSAVFAAWKKWEFKGAAPAGVASGGTGGGARTARPNS